VTQNLGKEMEVEELGESQPSNGYMLASSVMPLILQRRKLRFQDVNRVRLHHKAKLTTTKVKLELTVSCVWTKALHRKSGSC
jgi:hypothetical protein